MAKKYEVTVFKRSVSWMLGHAARFGIGNFVVLTTTGRKSGQSRPVTVAPIEDEGGEYLVSPYGESGWVLNLRANPVAQIERGGSVETVRLVEVTGQKPQLVKRYHDREAFARRFMDVPGRGDLADFAAVADRFPVFEMVRSS
jgi:deazaflavin-dependent oxidoreductase (nitroreductase family)